ncbi:alanine racemase [uncultured Faecalibaculum sp.]|uniref:alanine racemase n=1 Tax=uncultured Faecalibaculum sp. TaxID=1729681 RepID=UPI00262410A0|nr:alanine racemase [uncultured Faecalibaculum sp.]
MLDTAGERVWTEVDLDAVAHNLAQVRKLMGPTKIMGIVKDDAYGHGAVACSRVLEKNGVDFFGVATLEEALQLRQAGIRSDILILGWTDPAKAAVIAENNLIQTVVDVAYARALAATGIRLRTHVKADTGMNRIGISWQLQNKDLDGFFEVYSMKTLSNEGIFSHYPVSDDLKEDARQFTEKQTWLFQELLSMLRENGIDPGLAHIQNSYGILNYGDMGFDYCRPGLLYMGVTSDDAIPVVHELDFIPALSLRTRVTMVKDLKPGQTVSYGRHYTAEKPVTIASLGIGYGDGLPRLISNKGLMVLINGQKARLTGNICMDQCMADVTGLDVHPGDVVTIIGQDGDQRATVDEITRLSQSINNETFCRITARVPRYFTGTGDAAGMRKGNHGS